jgi:TonB family protein
VQADEPYDEFEIDWMPLWPDEEGRLEPIFFDGPQWIEFPDAEPLAAALEPAMADAALLVEFEEFALLDPEAGDEPEEPLPPAPRRASAASLAASFGVHLLTLFLLIGWHSAPAEIAGAIPVQLVIKEASAAPKEMPPGQSVAVSADQAPQAASSAVTPAEPPPARPQTQVASIKPPAKPRPPTPRPRPSAAPSQPAPPARAAKPAPAPPAKTAAAEQPTVQTAPAPVPRQPTAAAGAPSSASTAARFEGTASGVAIGEGDYFSRLEQLTRPYLYMLSPSFLAGRRGRTMLTVVVGDDGTIGRIGVKLSSGYPDIDARIEQMVQAVGRFPPLPQQLRRPSADLDFNLVFPDVLAQ